MMKQLKSINNQDILDQLKKHPNQGILFEIIETGVTGTILELSKDVLIVRENCNDPFVFVAGELTETNVSQITELLKDYKSPMVLCEKRFHPLFLQAYNIIDEVFIFPRLCYTFIHFFVINNICCRFSYNTST